MWMKLPNWDEKVYEFDWKVFFCPKDVCMKKKKLHQILSDCHSGTFLKKKGFIPSL